MDAASLVPAYHQLFPAPENADESWKPIAAEDISEIKVWARLGPRKALIPGPFGPLDLPDDAAFAAKFGGGVWEVVAYRHNGQVLRRRTFELAGAPRYAGAFGEASAPAAALPAPAAEGLTSPAVIAAAIGAATALLTAWMANSAEKEKAAQADRTAMLTMLLGAKDGAAGGHAELVKVLLERQVQAAAPVSLTDKLEEQVRLMEVLKKAGEKAGGGPEWLRALESIGPAVLQALGPVLLSRFMPAGMPSPPVDAPPLIRVVPG